MKIIDFKNLIKAMPVDFQSFDINCKSWENIAQNQIIDKIFKATSNNVLTVSRFDLFHTECNLNEFVIKVLMWGYPTKGRGINIETFLQPENYLPFIEKLNEAVKKKNITMSEVLELLNTKGLGFSTLSKILYFKEITIESKQTLILDRRVINALASGRFADQDIEIFKNLKYENAIKHYVEYLKFMETLASQMNTQADNIEMFLFMFGKNLYNYNR